MHYIILRFKQTHTHTRSHMSTAEYVGKTKSFFDWRQRNSNNNIGRTQKNTDSEAEHENEIRCVCCEISMLHAHVIVDTGRHGGDAVDMLLLLLPLLLLNPAASNGVQITCTFYMFWHFGASAKHAVFASESGFRGRDWAVKRLAGDGGRERLARGRTKRRRQNAMTHKYTEYMYIHFRTWIANASCVLVCWNVYACDRDCWAKRRKQNWMVRCSGFHRAKHMCE